MNEGTTPPTAAPPSDRFAFLRGAQQRHFKAVEEHETATANFLDAVNALPLPELMQGPVVRVTDLTTIQQAREGVALYTDDEDERERLIRELVDYRAERDQLAEFHGIADLAEMVAITAAAVARAGRAGA